MIKPSLKSSGPGFKDISKAVEEISRMQVLVGVPEEKSGRKEEEINNAQLTYIHTHGSNIAGIPPRPIIEPAIEAEDNKEKITRELSQASISALEGNKEKSVTFLKRAGMVAQNAVRAWFVDPRNKWAQNTPLTIARKGSDKPLIDTGQLRKSIIYIVKGKP